MNKKMTFILIILMASFLTAQSCVFDSSMFTASELASECIGVGDIVCDATKAYECDTVNGLTYTLYRVSEYDLSYCATTNENSGENY